MAVNRKTSKSYGIGSPFIDVFNAPIISNRNPSEKDKAPIGSIWIQQADIGDGVFAYAVYVITAIKKNKANWSIFNGDTIKKSVASPTVTQNFLSNRGAATFTGFTTAANGVQVLTITNSWIVAGAPILLTVSNGGANDAQMTVARVKTAAGSATITLVNNGAAALNGDIVVSYDLMLNTI